MQKNMLLIAVAALLSFSAVAQQKIAYLNSSDVIQSMPEFKAMTADLEKKQAEYKSMLEKMYGEYETKEKELQAMAQNNQNTQDAVFELKVKEALVIFLSQTKSDWAKRRSPPLRPNANPALKFPDFAPCQRLFRRCRSGLTGRPNGSRPDECGAELYASPPHNWWLPNQNHSRVDCANRPNYDGRPSLGERSWRFHSAQSRLG